MQISLPYDTFVLDNGLRVFLHEHHATPLVSVNLWYHVGSASERPGRTGFAHLFEHLMFEGSKHVPPGQFDNLLESLGATNNGSTNPDRTNYWEDVPSNGLEVALWLEADRMGWLADAMTQERLDGQRDVVRNERRQSYENRPYGLAFETILAALYPSEHPYSWPTIGSMADLAAATMDDVLAFFRTWYTPGNATLAIAGDIDAHHARALVERYFAEIPAGGAVQPVGATPVALARDVHQVLEDDVQLARLYMTWHSPAAYAEGDAEMEAIAQVLADGKASRLYRSLVYEKQVAQSVSAFQDGGRLGSAFYIVITARPGVALGPLEDEVRSTIAALATQGVRSEEVERARNHMETAFVDELQNVGGFGGRADRLNNYWFFVGDAGYSAQDLERYRAVTADHVRDVARRVLTRPCVTLSVVPRGRRELAAGSEGDA
ncbi:MAG TPA: pitrilysin family protein [Longimicrobiales bacterium]|nr:pitrilysin family protein [Longimicrobiales bacterium]